MSGGVQSGQGRDRDIQHPESAMKCTVLLRPVTSLPVVVLAKTPWEQSGG